MIKNIKVTNEFGESITITLADTEPMSGLFITEIEGLGPPKADVIMKSIATMDGKKYQTARGNEREIIIHFLFIPTNDVSVEDARQLTYKYFPLKRKVNIVIETDRRSVETEGYVESNEPDIFNENSNTIITLKCESPWLKKHGLEGSQEILFSDVDHRFEFIFEDPDDLSPTLEFSAIEIRRENVIKYKGEADSGIIMSMYAYGRFTHPTIYNNTTRERMSIDTNKVEALIGSPIKYGDEIRISTYQNDKYIHFIRDGRTINILNTIDKDADWFTIHPGDNIFSYTCQTGELDVEFTIKTQILLQGV